MLSFSHQPWQNLWSQPIAQDRHHRPQQQFSPPRSYRPSMTSPLSQHTATTSSNTDSVTSPTSGSVKTSTRPIPGPPSARATLSTDVTTAARRNLFLRKVRDKRDDGRFQSRAQELERLDRAEYLNEVRRWEAQVLRDAPLGVVEDDEELTEDGTADAGRDGLRHVHEGMDGDLEVEDVARMEEGEMDALISMMEHEEAESQVQSEENKVRKKVSSQFGSEDDEDLDGLFEDMIGMESHPVFADGDEMDTGT